MKRFTLGALAALLLLAAPATRAQDPPACTDYSEQCLTTDHTTCTGLTTSVQVQIGGPGAEDSNGVDGNYTGTCEGTDAIALVIFEKVSATELKVTVENLTCGDNGSLTALYHNFTTTVTGYTLGSYDTDPTGTLDEVWDSEYTQTTATNDPGGIKADGFGSFDAALFNGDSTSPNGGNKNDIRAGETLVFNTTVAPGFNLCDFLTEISTPQPSNRNRNLVGRWQACGPDEENSAFIGPCKSDDELLAVIDDIRLLPGNNTMRVEWSTSLEIQNAGFNVLRREATRGGWDYVNIELLPGQGDTVTGADYTFVDNTALNGVEYMYRVEDIDFSGKNDLSEIRKEVTNPPSPQVRLTHPPYGAKVDLAERPRFSFNGNGLHGRLIIQISADPTFAEETVVSTNVSGRFGTSDVTLPRRTARIVETIAHGNEGIVYWRLVDSSQDPVSETFRVEIEAGERRGFFKFGARR